jgi:hypothetical protein
LLQHEEFFLFFFIFAYFCTAKCPKGRVKGECSNYHERESKGRRKIGLNSVRCKIQPLFSQNSWPERKKTAFFRQKTLFFMQLPCIQRLTTQNLVFS